MKTVKAYKQTQVNWGKSQFVALDFGAVEVIKEFMAHLVVLDKQGQSKTLYQLVAPQYCKGLLEGKQGEIKLLPHMEDSK